MQLDYALTHDWIDPDHSVPRERHEKSHIQRSAQLARTTPWVQSPTRPPNAVYLRGRNCVRRTRKLVASEPGFDNMSARP